MISLERRVKTQSPDYVFAGSAAATTRERVATPEQAALEFLLNALRLPDGVGIEVVEARAGQPVAMIAAGRAAAVERGWLVEDAAVLRATPAGLERLNRLLSRPVSVADSGAALLLDSLRLNGGSRCAPNVF
jgi:oxygen-independent coproporphyrinogen-3 oxidase